MRIGLAQRALRPLGELGRRLLLYRVDFGVADAAAAREQVGDGGLVGEVDRLRAPLKTGEITRRRHHRATDVELGVYALTTQQNRKHSRDSLAVHHART